MRDLQQYNAPIDFVDGRCDLRLRPTLLHGSVVGDERWTV
jgi:hypothetical protein